MAEIRQDLKLKDDPTTIVRPNIVGDCIPADAITNEKIASGAVTSTKIGTGAVTPGKIASDAVTSSKISTGAVTSSKIEDSAVTATKIASGAVLNLAIADGAISTSKLASKSVTRAKIDDEAVGYHQIDDNAVGKSKLSLFLWDVGAELESEGFTTLAEVMQWFYDNVLSEDLDSKRFVLFCYRLAVGGGETSFATCQFTYDTPNEEVYFTYEVGGSPTRITCDNDAGVASFIQQVKGIYILRVVS